MKHLSLHSVLVLASLLASATLHAAVPLRWTVETSRLAPAVFDVVRGETIALEAAFNSSGKPFAMDLEPVSIFWQTNGMGSAWWTAPAVATSNLVRATFTPEMDPGAATVNGFLGSSGSIYRAAFTFRFRHGPGAVPNTLPLPVPVIDFSKVKVLNPPWGGGGGGGVDTNAVRDIAREEIKPATNRLYKTLIDSMPDGAARPLPAYLHALYFADSYPNEAAAYYRSRGNGKTDGGCSSVRDGGFLYRNFDYPFDDRAEFVVHMSSGPARFASVGVAQVGTNLTEQIVTSGKPSRWYKALPGATVDGINENGVACNINVVDGPVTNGWHTTGNLHPLGAIRWILDNATNAQHGAEYIAANIRFPQGLEQNFHYMIADATSTYIVENGSAHAITNGVPAITNFRLYPTPSDGEGQERYIALTNGANITSQWWTLTYTPAGYRASDLHGITGEDLANLFNYWENNPREAHRGERFGDKVWWQTLHTSIYDLTNRTLRVAVQETDDWYTFAVPSAGGVKPEAVREIVGPMIAASTNGLATTNGVAEAIAANERTGTEEQIVRGRTDGDGWFIDVQRAYEADYANGAGFAEAVNWYGVIDPPTTLSGYGITDGATKTELAAKRDLADNRCAADGFTEWTFGGGAIGIDGVYTLFENDGAEEYKWFLYHYEEIVGKSGDGTGFDVSITFDMYDEYLFPSAPTATRSRVCTSNELFVTQGYVTNSIATLAPAPGNYAAVSNAAMNAISTVTNADANLIYTITSDGAEPRFYFTPVGAIDPED